MSEEALSGIGSQCSDPREARTTWIARTQEHKNIETQEREG